MDHASMFLKPQADVLNGKPCVGENRLLLIRNKQCGRKDMKGKELEAYTLHEQQGFLMQGVCGIDDLFICCNQSIDLGFI